MFLIAWTYGVTSSTNSYWRGKEGVTYGLGFNAARDYLTRGRIIAHPARDVQEVGGGFDDVGVVSVWFGGLG